MNPFKLLLLVVVSTGLACSAFAIERSRYPDTPAPAARSTAKENGAAGASVSAAPVMQLSLPAAANYRLASAAAVQYAAVDVSRIGVRAAASTGADTAPGTGSAGTAPGGPHFPVAAMPEPADWMQLLCGLVVAGFIARRRTGLAAD